MPIITISRGSFAGGRAVAERLSQQLQIPTLGREELLLETAKEYGILESDLKQALNESPPFWQQVLGKRLAYIKCMTAVLLDHASQGDLIYHGHVGHLLLSSIPHVLKVRVIADLEYRIQAAMKQVNLTREAALAHIRKVDEERSRWARLLYGVDWEDQTQYHLVVNLGWLSVASASEAVIRLSEMAEFRPTLEGMAGYEDLRLSCRVWGALAKNPQTRNAGIQVTAHGGEIVVSGNVPSGKTLEVLPRIAGQVEGVRSVRCEAGMGTDWYW